MERVKRYFWRKEERLALAGGLKDVIEVWIDGLCEPINPGGTACFAYIIKKNGETIDRDYGVIGSGKGMTNNVGEYTALVRALEKIRSLKLEKEKAVVRSDSRLVAYGMGADPSTGRCWKIKAPLVLPLCTRAKTLAEGMDIEFQWIRREENEEADRLTRLAYESKRQ
jgi:ribonuclease HI